MAYYPLATEHGALYRLVGADGVSVATFNDPNDPNYVGMLTEVTGLDSADVRESASEMVEADGGTHGIFYLGRRPITMAGKVFGHQSIAERNLRIDRARRASLALRGDSTLSWKPSTRNENLVVNPRAQNNTTGWATTGTGLQGGATLTRQTGVAPPVGTTTFQIATSGATNAFQGAATTLSLVAGRTYAFSVAYRRTVGTGSGQFVINSTDGANSAALASGLTASGWTVVTGTFTPTQTATYFLALRQSDSNSLASTFQFTDVLASPGTNTTYRDGDSTGHYWQGDAGNSASGDFIEQFTTVRRQGPFRETGAWVKEFQIPLVSEYAYIFGSQIKTVAAGVAAENRGNMPAYPIISITGGSTDPTVSDGTRVFRTLLNASSGGALAAGETVEFDMLNHTGKFTAGARNGQSANRYINWATTAWPYLTGLGTTQTFTLTGGGTLSVRYRDAWA